MCAKSQGCEWNISVLKNSLKIGFEFKESRSHVEPCLESQKSPSVKLSCLNFLC